MYFKGVVGGETFDIGLFRRTLICIYVLNDSSDMWFAYTEIATETTNVPGTPLY